VLYWGERASVGCEAMFVRMTRTLISMTSSTDLGHPGPPRSERAPFRRVHPSMARFPGRAAAEMRGTAQKPFLLGMARGVKMGSICQADG
jgi:hypothetical protein